MAYDTDFDIDADLSPADYESIEDAAAEAAYLESLAYEAAIEAALEREREAEEAYWDAREAESLAERADRAGYDLGFAIILGRITSA